MLLANDAIIYTYPFYNVYYGDQVTSDRKQKQQQAHNCLTILYQNLNQYLYYSML